MNRLILCLFLLTIFAVAKGQRNYDDAIKMGDEALQRQEYDSAISKYFAAEAFDPKKKDLVKAKVKRAFVEINRLRAHAVNAQTEAEKARKEAVKANGIANEQKKIALVSQLTAESEIVLIKTPSQIEKSVLLALKAMEVEYTPETEEVLRKNLALLSRPVFKLSHRGSMTKMSLSDDNRYLATAINNIASVWDIKAVKEIFSAEHDDNIAFIAIDSLSRFLVTGSDSTAIVWELNSKREIYRFQNQAKNQVSTNSSTVPKIVRITGLSFSPNGQYLLIATGDSSVQVIDILSQKLKVAFKTDFELGIIKFSHNGEFVAGIDNYNIRSGSQIMAWEVITGFKKLQAIIPGRVNYLEMGANGNYVAIASNEDTTELWDINTQRKKVGIILPGRSKPFALSPDGKFLWATNGQNDIYKWDINSSHEVFRIRNGSRIRLLSMSLDGQYITATSFGSVKIWETQSADPVASIYHQEGYLNSISFSGDDKFLFMHRKGLSTREERINNLIIWSIPDKAKTFQSSQVKDIEDEAIISNDGKFLFSTFGDSVYKEDLKTKDTLLKAKLEGIAFSNQNSFRLVAFSPDGRYLMKVLNERPLLWQIDTGCHLINLKLPDSILQAEFSPSGSLLTTISAGEDTSYVIEIFDLKSKKRKIKKSYAWLFPFFTISYDDKYLAFPDVESKSENNETYTVPTSVAILVRLENKKEFARIPFPAALNSLVFSPDGNYLLGVHDNNIASVFDIQKRNEVARIDNQFLINTVLFSPQRKYIVTAGNNGFVRLWLWRREDLVDLACSCISRNFTFHEWKEYFGETRYQLVCKNLPPHPSLLEEGKEKARSGDLNAAMKILKLAIDLGDTSKRDPKKWVMQEAAIGALERGEQMAKKGAIKEAVESFSKAQKFDTSIKISAKQWNDLAWQGAIRNHAALVIDAINHALELEPDDGGYRDTRGVIRALSGNFTGAIEDFEYYIKWGTEKNRRSKQRIDQRKKWIEELKVGRNPFDSKTLEELNTTF